MGPSGLIGYILDYIALFGIGYAGFRQVLYLGRAPCTKETLPDFCEKCRVTRHSRVFRELTGSQWIPGFWGVTVKMLLLPHLLVILTLPLSRSSTTTNTMITD